MSNHVEGKKLSISFELGLFEKHPLLFLGCQKNFENHLRNRVDSLLML
jgi:hypothetical protein